ncbi:OmpW/AlkL family protein [Ketobacter sp.]|uniref:OmpW/AlkL family protein n=1 Tax=Ketobacter sp. TaxID=2083498 RepID=UPI000F172292|nr:OmpW family outer membrane protein [Ketobacter sp.]RLU01322.1 MAG: OmpW family protein [Ketobacter sp.]
MNRLMSPACLAVMLAAISSGPVVAAVEQPVADQSEGQIEDQANYWDRFKTKTLGLEAGAKPFYLRAGYTSLQPDSSSDEVSLDVPSDSPTTLAISSGPIEGSGASVNPVSFPSAIVGYRLPWDRGQWSIETILALPFTVEFEAEGTLKDESIAPYALGNIPTGVEPLGSEFGESKVLPPVVTVVYRFLMDKPLRPYIGGGLSYMITYDAEVTNPVLTAVGEPELEIDDVLGYVVQGGVEYNFYKDWWVNFDVKFIGGLEAEATVKNIWVETPDLPTYSPAEVGDASVNVTVDPWVYHIGVGFDF